MTAPSSRLRRPIQMSDHRVAMLPTRLLLVLLLVAFRLAEAQPSSTPSGDLPDGNYNVKISPALAALLIAFICGFFFLGFFSVYLRRCAGDSSAIGGRAAGIDGEGFTLGRRRRGLDRAVLETFPTMAYAKAKELRPEKEAMECAVCLSEFSDEDILRLLPGCCHVFHVDCVDVWLESHVTCPVCRANLSDPSTVTAADSRAQEATSGDAVTTEGEEDLEAGRGAPEVPAVRRWNSTGHEATPMGPDDRYTLRLPEHVRREIMEAGRLRRAASLTVPSGGEASGRRGYRGGASAGAGRSGRWGFLLRTFSVRRRVELAPTPGRSASSKRIFPSDGAPSGIAVGGGGVEGKSESDKKDEEKPSSSTSSEPAEERV